MAHSGRSGKRIARPNQPVSGIDLLNTNSEMSVCSRSLLVKWVVEFWIKPRVTEPPEMDAAGAAALLPKLLAERVECLLEITPAIGRSSSTWTARLLPPQYHFLSSLSVPLGCVVSLPAYPQNPRPLAGYAIGRLP